MTKLDANLTPVLNMLNTRYFIFPLPVLFNALLQQLHNVGRTLEVAGAADTYLNEYHAYTFAFTSCSKKSPTVSTVTE